MEKKGASAIVSILLLTSILALAFNIQPAKARFYPGPGKGAATIYITPQYNNFTNPPTKNGTWFTVNVRIANATFVAAWEVELWYNKNYLYTNSSMVEYSSDMIFPPGTYPSITPLVDSQNSTHNHVAEIAATYAGVEYIATDAGLITVKFQIIKIPVLGQTLSSILYLAALPEAGFGSWTLDENKRDNDLTVYDGYFQIARLSGDVNGDKKVDGRDIALLAKYFGSTGGFPQEADVNNDGKVDGKDIAIASENFGTVYP